YLDDAPVVLASRELVPDLLDPARPRQVPMAYQTDGRWVWSSSVAYYLRTHGVCPDLAFLAHIRLHRYALPKNVPSPKRARALSAATNQIAHVSTATNTAELFEPGLAGEFDSPGDAATYLIGFFYSYAGSLQRA
ncbi:hypothetical protein AB0G82_38625, partial [Streptomyces anulatus]